MKKTFVIFGMLLAGATFFNSCTKNLKKDINDLKQHTDSLQKRNAELQDRLNGVENVLGSNEPIAVTTTFKDDNDSTRTVTAIYPFKSSNRATQSLIKHSDGRYEIYIERFNGITWDEGAWVEFTYDPVSKQVSNKRGGHYWTDFDPYGDLAYYYPEYASTGLSFDINVKSINPGTGDISLTFSASGTGEYTNAVSGYGIVPNPGKSVSTTFSFTGKLGIFTAN